MPGLCSPAAVSGAVLVGSDVKKWQPEPCGLSSCLCCPCWSPQRDPASCGVPSTEQCLFMYELNNVTQSLGVQKARLHCHVQLDICSQAFPDLDGSLQSSHLGTEQ